MGGDYIALRSRSKQTDGKHVFDYTKQTVKLIKLVSVIYC